MKKEMKNQIAVITGASQGLGKAFVKELAKRQMNVVLVSLPGQNLSQLSEWISREYKVQTWHYETDFSTDRNILNLAGWLNANFNISVLINNAGIGGTKAFEEAQIDYIDSIIQVNIKATTLLTHQLLPNLKRQPRSYILNVSSIAAFSPVGYKTVYPASKAFVHFFSRGLYAELKDTNVFVSVINPGPMATSEEITSRIKRQGIIGKLTLLKPENVARYAITRLLKKDTVIMVNPLIWLVSIMLPIWIKLPIMTKIVKRELNYETSICNGC
ncbi:MAG: SDR family NAD(P)-dependent oxidoreductase [Bacteroidota bacterium]